MSSRFFIALLLPVRLAAGPTPTAAPAVRPCSAAEYGQFDFWIGDWEVRRPDGKLAGENRIESILGGCALRESWRGTSGSVGTSLNSWDPGTRRWHQTWVDGDGLLLQIDGGLRGGAMVLEGETVSSAGQRTRQRTTWTPLPGGRVRQLWQQSTDGGKKWVSVFDGTYSRKRGRRSGS